MNLYILPVFTSPIPTNEGILGWSYSDLVAIDLLESKEDIVSAEFFITFKPVAGEFALVVGDVIKKSEGVYQGVIDHSTKVIADNLTEKVKK